MRGNGVLVEERVFGLLVGLGVGAVIGFFLRSLENRRKLEVVRLRHREAVQSIAG